MTHRADVARGREIIARWCILAEQRLEHLTELFETGRWRRYHSELAFLENIQEAKAAVKIWRDLETREASRDNSALDMSWLGRTRAALPRVDALGDRVHWSHPALIVDEPPLSDVLISAQAGQISSDDAPSAPVMDAPALFEPVLDEQGLDEQVSFEQVSFEQVSFEQVSFEPASDAQTLDNAPALTFDIAAIEQRYPLLRNAL